jgi:pyroglutamyl-peptidase
MRTLLITGFGPFPGVPLNPTEILARRLATLPGLAPDWRREVRVLATGWDTPERLDVLLADVRPDAVFSLGVARCRPRMMPERFGLNRATVSRKDATGARRVQGELLPGGPERVECRIDVARVSAAMRAAGAPARVSWSAGAYLCNALAYALYRRETPALFVHVPMPAHLPAPVAGRPDEATLERGLAAGLAAFLETLPLG